MELLSIVFAAVGFVISLYGLVIHRRMMADSSYKPACDFSRRVSCSRALLSDGGNLVGVHNTVLGVVFYPSIALLFFYEVFLLTVLLSTASVLVSLYLAYLLVRQQNFCVVCITIYIINVLILYSAVTV